VRYLSEGNYEEAIIAFTAAIEIDPKRALPYVGRGDAYIGSGETEGNLAAALADYKQAIGLDETNAEAYLGLANVYILFDEYDKALEILQQGLEKAESNESIAEKLSKLENLSSNDYSKFITDNLISEDEFAIAGTPFYELSLDEAIPLLPPSVTPSEIREETDYSGAKIREYSVYTRITDSVTGGVINCAQKSPSMNLTSLHFNDYYENTIIGVQTNIRDIKTGDTISDVLVKLGISLEGADLLSQTRLGIYINANHTTSNKLGGITTGEHSGSYNEILTRPLSISTGNCQCNMSFVDDKLINMDIWVVQ